MAAANSAQSSMSPESYIGSFISLTSKSDIRYEGFLFHLRPQESTIGLRNVKSFGTEGRRKDGPQILPSEKVYEYIFFRGSDIKDLQVISSPTVQSTSDVPNDPAIVQPHYPHPTSAPTNLLSTGVAPVTTVKPNLQSGPPTSTFQGIPPLYPSVGSSLPPPPTANGNGLAMPTYWPGFTGSSGEICNLQQQCFAQPLQGLAASPPVQQLIQYPSTHASSASRAFNFAEFSRPLLPPVCTGSLNLTTTGSTPSPFLSNLPVGQSATLPSSLSNNLMPNDAPNTLLAITLGSSSPVLPSLTTHLNVDVAALSVTDKPKSVLGPASPYPIVSQSMPSTAGTISASLSEASIPSLVTPGQLLRPRFTTPPSSHFSQAANEDIEAIQALSSDSKNAQEPAQQLPLASAERLNGVTFQPHDIDRHHAQGRGNGPNGAVSHTHHSNKGHAWGRGNLLNGAASRTHNSYRGHAEGRAYRLNGATLHPHHSNRGHSHGREDGTHGAALYTHQDEGSNGWGRRFKMSPTERKFTEEFDFEAMNEKFNKAEVWCLLGKSNKVILDGKEEDEKKSDGNDAQNDDGDGLPKLDMKPGYVKDDFFDSLSSRNMLNHESGRGRMILSEQRKIDIETFGEFQRLHGRGSQGGGSRGSYRGRGYGHAGRGRGRTVWSRVT